MAGHKLYHCDTCNKTWHLSPSVHDTYEYDEVSGEEVVAIILRYNPVRVKGCCSIFCDGTPAGFEPSTLDPYLCSVNIDTESKT